MNDFLSLMTCLFRNSWNFLTSIHYPGTGIPIAVILLGAFLCVFGLRLIGFFTGIEFGDRFIRGGNNTKIRIDDIRKADTK